MQANDEDEPGEPSPSRRPVRMMVDRAHSANSELAVLAEVLSVLPARSGSVSNSGRLELDAAVRQTLYLNPHLTGTAGSEAVAMLKLACG